MIHLAKEHGSLVSWQIDKQQEQAWKSFSQDGLVTVQPQQIIVWPNHVVQIKFTSAHPKETRLPFRLSSVTPEGNQFGFMIRCNVAPLEPTVAIISPAFNRVPLMPWFMIGILLIAAACLIISFILAMVDRKTTKEKILKPLETPWIVLMIITFAIMLGFLAFWSVVQAFKSKRPSAFKCQETKATVANGTCVYSYEPDSSAWDKFLCRTLGVCRSFPPMIQSS